MARKRTVVGPGPGAAARVLADARRRAGLTQRELAERAALPQSAVSVYERGRREPSLPTLQRLVGAAGFRVRLDLEPVGPDVEHNGRVLRDLLGLVDAIQSPVEVVRRPLANPLLESGAGPR